MAGVANKVANIANGLGVKAAAIAMTNRTINEISKDPSKLYDSEAAKDRRSGKRSFFTSDPVQQVENMFYGGKWLNTYEIPYFGNDYLKGTYSNKWTLGNVNEALGSGLGGIFADYGFDYPSNPKFKVSMPESSNRSLTTEFYLINSNDEWLKRNFKFIHAFFAGTSWMHLNYCMVRPPNVYHVLCPGRFQFMWAAIDCTVTFEGKLRKNQAVSEFFKGMGIGSIDEDMLWPDAWKMTITIKDLTPNNFNMYAEYYMNGFNGNEIASLSEKITAKQLLTDLVKYVTNAVVSTVQTGKDTLDNAEGLSFKEMTELATKSINDIKAGVAKALEREQAKEEEDKK